MKIFNRKKNRAGLLRVVAGVTALTAILAGASCQNQTFNDTITLDIRAGGGQLAKLSGRSVTNGEKGSQTVFDFFNVRILEVAVHGDSLATTPGEDCPDKNKGISARHPGKMFGSDGPRRPPGPPRGKGPWQVIYRAPSVPTPPREEEEQTIPQPPEPGKENLAMDMPDPESIDETDLAAGEVLLAKNIEMRAGAYSGVRVTLATPPDFALTTAGAEVPSACEGQVLTAEFVARPRGAGDPLTEMVKPRFPFPPMVWMTDALLEKIEENPVPGHPGPRGEAGGRELPEPMRLGSGFMVESGMSELRLNFDLSEAFTLTERDGQCVLEKAEIGLEVKAQ